MTDEQVAYLEWLDEQMHGDDFAAEQEWAEEQALLARA